MTGQERQAVILVLFLFWATGSKALVDLASITSGEVACMDGNIDGGVYARGSLWSDWEPRRLLDAMLYLNEDDDGRLYFTADLDTPDELFCFIMYGCESFTTDDHSLSASDCVGDIVCISDTHLRSSVLDGLVFRCLNKWNAGWKCVAEFLFLDPRYNPTPGQLVFRPVESWPVSNETSVLPQGAGAPVEQPAE